MSCDAGKSVLVVSDQIQHKMCGTASEDGLGLNILDLGRQGFVIFKLAVQLICVFVLAYMEKSCFLMTQLV